MHPAQIGQYRLGAKLGEGGMGVVYAAEDEQQHRSVAVKLLRPELSQEPKAVERFHREAKICATLNHPHICAVYDSGEHEGSHYLITELLEGQSLHEKLGGWPLPLEHLLDLAIQIADAIEAAHAKGVIHRDIKSSNIFITDTGVAKLFDFGLAKLCTQEPPSQPAQGLVEVVSMPGFTLGTVTHMSPEQVEGKELDSRSDQFSFGIVLYEMATGMLPFRGLDSVMIMQAIANEPYPLPSKLNPNVPCELDEIIGKTLRKDCAERYENMTKLKAVLLRLLQQLEHGGKTSDAEVASEKGAASEAEPQAASAPNLEPPPQGCSSPVPQIVVETWSSSGSSRRRFIKNGSGILYWFRASLGEISSPIGFRDSLQQALDNPRIAQIRFVLDPIADGMPQLWSQLMTPLIQSWAQRRHRLLEVEVAADRGRYYDPATGGTAMSWIFADLSQQGVPSFKIFVRARDAATAKEPAGSMLEAELLVATRLRSVRMRDGSRLDLRIPDRLLRVRTEAKEVFLSSLLQIVRRWEDSFAGVPQQQ